LDVVGAETHTAQSIQVWSAEAIKEAENTLNTVNALKEKQSRALRTLKRAKQQLESELKCGGLLVDTPSLMAELAQSNVEEASIVADLTNLETIAGKASSSIDQQLRDGPSLRPAGQGTVAAPTGIHNNASSSVTDMYGVAQLLI